MLEMVLSGVVILVFSNGQSLLPAIGPKWGPILTGNHLMIALARPCHCHRMAKPLQLGHHSMVEMVFTVVMFAYSNGQRILPLGPKWGQILMGSRLKISLAGLCPCHRMAKLWR
jgi:hypothetical protein